MMRSIMVKTQHEGRFRMEHMRKVLTAAVGDEEADAILSIKNRAELEDRLQEDDVRPAIEVALTLWWAKLRVRITVDDETPERDAPDEELDPEAVAEAQERGTGS